MTNPETLTAQMRALLERIDAFGGRAQTWGKAVDLIEELEDGLKVAVVQVERLEQAARGVLGQFDRIVAHQHKLLVEGQTLESAAANWDEATSNQFIDFEQLRAALRGSDR